MNSYFCLDIETSALPKEVLSEITPEFEADKRLTDPVKVKASLETKAAEWLASAALDAHRGEVLAVGLITPAGQCCLIHGATEADMLVRTRAYATEWADKTVVGHYLLGFDIPFLCRRMWKHGIKPPVQWLDCTPWRATWAFDTKFVWGCGNKDQRISLDNLAWHLGVGRKNGDGADFGKLYETDREKALDYLRNDLKLTEGCYLKMRGAE